MGNRPRDPRLANILQAATDKSHRHIHKAMPARVVEYDVETQHATVQLLVQLDGETVAPLQDVPVCFPGGAAGFLHVPLAAGDNVLIVFCDEDFSKWWETGSISPPLIEQRHGLYPIAIPGLVRAAAPFLATAGHVTLAAEDELRLGSDEATEAVALANLVLEQLNALKAAINDWAPVANDGGAALKVKLGELFVDDGWPASVAAEKVKAE